MKKNSAGVLGYEYIKENSKQIQQNRAINYTQCPPNIAASFIIQSEHSADASTWGGRLNTLHDGLLNIIARNIHQYIILRQTFILNSCKS